MKCCVLRHLIWIYIVCLCPKNRTPGLYGLRAWYLERQHYKSEILSPQLWYVDSDVGWLCWGLTSQSTIFQSCRDGAIASWVINQYFRGVKCLAQGHNMAAVGLEPRTSRSGIRHSTTELPRSPDSDVNLDAHPEKYISLLFDNV